MEVRWIQPLLESYTVCFRKGRVWFDTPYGKTSKTQQLFVLFDLIQFVFPTHKFLARLLERSQWRQLKLYSNEIVLTRNLRQHLVFGLKVEYALSSEVFTRFL